MNAAQKNTSKLATKLVPNNTLKKIVVLQVWLMLQEIVTVPAGKNAELHALLFQVKYVGIHVAVHRELAKVIKLALTTKEQIYANVVQRNISRPVKVKRLTKTKLVLNNTLKKIVALQDWLTQIQEIVTVLAGKNAEHHALHSKEKLDGMIVLVQVRLDHVKVISAVAHQELLSVVKPANAAPKHTGQSAFQNATMKTRRQPAQLRE